MRLPCVRGGHHCREASNVGYRLIGGAILSALRYSADPSTRHRVYANVLIATGAILPGIGGTATRMGYVEVLYVTELAGLLLTWLGYRMSVHPASAPTVGLAT